MCARLCPYCIQERLCLEAHMSLSVCVFLLSVQGPLMATMS